jgi:hypothetical protein
MTWSVREGNLLYVTTKQEHYICKITTSIIKEDTLSQICTVFDISNVAYVSNKLVTRRYHLRI